MRNRAFLLTALAISFATTAYAAELMPIPIPSAFSLLGAPQSPGPDIPIPNPLLRVSLNPQPLPPLPNPDSGLSLTNPSMPMYSYPAFEVSDFSFDVEQVLNVGSQSSGSGAGKVTFNPFQISKQSSRLDLVNGDTVLETIDVDIDGVNTDSPVVATYPELLPCGAVLCAFEALSFTALAPDPVVSFSVTSGSTGIAFSIVPEPSTWPMMLLGFGALGFASYRARRKSTAVAA